MEKTAEDLNISANLAGVITFLAQGIEPLSRWKARKAKKATMLAIAGWIIMLIIL
jgi:hypothetical protein